MHIISGTHVISFIRVLFGTGLYLMYLLYLIYVLYLVLITSSTHIISCTREIPATYIISGILFMLYTCYLVGEAEAILATADAKAKAIEIVGEAISLKVTQTNGTEYKTKT